MKLFVCTIAVAIIAGSVPSFAATDQMTKITDSYLKIQEALASDSLDGVPAEASNIATISKDKALTTPARSLSKDKSLEDARKHFRALSVAMDKWARTEKPQGVDRMSCPMVKAPWLQKHGNVKNPYLGKEMQSCGEVQK